MESSHAAPPVSPVKKYRFKFSGNFFELLKLVIKNTILTVLTFGIYIPYARTNMRKYLWRSSTFGGKPFLFHGDPRNLLKGYAILFGIILGVGVISNLGGSLFENFAPIRIFFKGVPQLTFFLLLVVFQFRAYSYLVNNTSFRSVRFNVNPAGLRPFVLTSFKGFFFCILTLGLYYPFMAHEHSKIKWKNTAYGSHGFSYSGKDKEYALAWYKGFFLTLFSLGLYSPWFAVTMHRYTVDHLKFQGAKFSTTVTGLDCLFLFMKSMLLLVITFGLATPYILNMNLAFYFEHLSMKGDLNFEEILQSNRTLKDDSLGDGISDLFDGDVA